MLVRQNAQELSDGGVCRLLLDALSTHPADARIQEAACRAVGYCAEASPGMRGELGDLTAGELDGCQLVCRALQLHPEQSLVQKWGLFAVMAMAQCQQNAVKLGCAGACTCAMEALRLHAGDRDVQETACQAVGKCSDASAALRDELGRLGACELVRTALQLHPASVLTQVWGLYAVACLAQSHSCALEFGRAGTCEVVLAGIHAHPSEADAQVRFRRRVPHHAS
ncbi:hypothetical protein JKP88DRAFT_158846 [Tribonema minus]|uniref:Uncharacterized protein n=1 Tax=Tribonema minus TaxID=303371 RepID=A0A835YPB3_9STRA|nr:hypothetical protein JKP88DRAFT_158846 [Tribonema minus]